VTERTILRDIAYLRGRGEEITSSGGPGGGFILDRSARLPPVRLTVEEVVGLALAAAMARRVSSGLPYSVAADHAIDKLIRTLPKERAASFRHLTQHMFIGAPASDAMHSDLGLVEGGLLQTFEAALSTKHCLAFDYVDRHGQTSTRVVEPHGLLLRVPIWYVIAYDPLRDAPRVFRVDRMRAVELSDDVFEPRPPAVFAQYIDPRFGDPAR